LGFGLPRELLEPKALFGSLEGEGREAKRRAFKVGNIGGNNGKIFHIFLKSFVLENDKIMLIKSNPVH